jgi:prepilin-type N-terminal cleavage/methylation domain-containing protein/prepilin-type processing-associated H-X9-DG protein
LPKHFKNGFTLIELLVVIALMSFLLALIVPALGRAKDQSKLLICRSNQKNLLLGCRAYANDYNSKLPVSGKLHNPHTKLIDKLRSSQYITNKKIYYCPSEKKDELKFSPQNVTDGNIGYFYYCYSDRATHSYLSKFLRKNIPWSREITDTMGGDTLVFSDAWFSGVPTAHRWHKKGVNYATLDGSVRMVKEGPKEMFR